jgi:hypothetical protein
MQPFTLYKHTSSNPAVNAQRNLMGRTHYVDPETLRFHHARILDTYIVDGGCLFALIESYAVDYHNTERRKRFVVFDLCGNVVERAGLEDGWRTKGQALKAMWACLNSLDALSITAEAIERQRRYTLDALDRLAGDAEQALAATEPQEAAR